MKKKIRNNQRCETSVSSAFQNHRELNIFHCVFCGWRDAWQHDKLCI